MKIAAEVAASIDQNEQVCLSFANIIVQKGYKIAGRAKSR